MKTPPPDFIEVEVVSAGGRDEPTRENPDPLFALVAKLMDNIFVIPGTGIRFGLDPLIGLIPGLGDGSSALISALLIVRGAKAGLPRIVLTRMALNVLLNTFCGAIPIVGDAFSVWFKSNQLNYALYQKHLQQARTSRKQDWLFVTGLLAILALLVVLTIVVSVILLKLVWNFIAH